MDKLNIEMLETRFGELEKLNSGLSKAKLMIANYGKNRKNFNIPKEVFEKAFPSLLGSPVVAHFFDDEEIGGHEKDIVKIDGEYRRTGKTYAYGFVDYVTMPYWENIDGKDWLCVNTYIFTERFPESVQILKAQQSMEVKLSVDNVGADGVANVSGMQFLACCALHAKGVTPAFENSHFEAFSLDGIKEDVDSMKQEFEEFAKGEDKSTPAKQSEKIKGSDKNKEGSASTKGSKIDLNDATVKSLESKVKEHNESVDNKSSKRATLSDLKKVYRRGAGAYSTSHRSNVSSRNQWAMGRVNAYLYLLKNGKPKDKDYVTDNDLLPKDHPKKSTNMSNCWLEELIDDLYVDYGIECNSEQAEALYEEFKDDYESFAVPEKYKHINFKPPESVAKAAQRGLDMREKQSDSNKCCTPTGLARARQLTNKQTLSPSTIKRMKAFFDRHQVDKKGKDWDNQSKGRQSWLIWGGDAGYRWAKKVVNQMNKADEKIKMSAEFAIDKGSKDFIEYDTSAENSIKGNVGEKNVSELKRKVLEASNYKEIIPKFFLVYPSDMSSDFNADEIKYPLGSFKDGRLYYNIGFINAASSQLMKQKDKPYFESAKSRLNKVRRKFDMEKFTESEVFALGEKMQKAMMGMMEKYGMRYMPYAMDEEYVYAMDTEKEMAKMMIPYAMAEEEMAMDYEKMMAMDYEDKEMAIKTVMGILSGKLMEMKKENMGMMEKYSETETELKSAKEKLDEFSEFKKDNSEILKKIVDMKASIEAKDAEIEKLSKENEKFSAELDEVKLEKKKEEAKNILGAEQFSVFTDEEKSEMIETVKDMDIEEFTTKTESKCLRKLLATEKFSMPEKDPVNVMGRAKVEEKEKVEDEPKSVWDKL